MGTENANRYVTFEYEEWGNVMVSFKGQPATT